MLGCPDSCCRAVRDFPRDSYEARAEPVLHHVPRSSLPGRDHDDFFPEAVLRVAAGQAFGRDSVPRAAASNDIVRRLNQGTSVKPRARSRVIRSVGTKAHTRRPTKRKAPDWIEQQLARTTVFTISRECTEGDCSSPTCDERRQDSRPNCA